MAKASPNKSEKLALYEKLVATQAGVERKGAAMPYTSVNGHMFSFLTSEGKLALRLPSPIREEFVQDFHARPCEQHGAVMKEYVEVPDSLLKKTKELAKYFSASYSYVAALKPKPTKKRPTTKKARPKTE